METKVVDGPAYAAAVFTLEAEQSIQAGAGTLNEMSENIEIETKAMGGGWRSLKRVVARESFFQNTMTARDTAGWVRVSQVLPGDVEVVDLKEGAEMMLQSGAYIASGTGVEFDTSWGGAKTFFGGKGLFLLRCTGHGPLAIGAYGALVHRELAPEETVVVSADLVVGFEGTVTYKVTKMGNIKTTILGGKGPVSLAARLTGPGRVFTQTRSIEMLKALMSTESVSSTILSDD
jgi:uncharacterized protein (TIGR00266 family)